MTNPVDLMRQMMEQLGITPEDLLNNATNTTTPASTVAEFMPKVRNSARETISRAYNNYWIKMEHTFGDRPVNSLKASDVAAWVEECGRTAVIRRNSRYGTNARENAISAARYFFKIALHDGEVQNNPALAVPKPRRTPSPRRALNTTELAQIEDVTRNGGNDPRLDTLLYRFHLETGARRGGALVLRLMDLDPVRQTIRLREKGGTEHWQPVSKRVFLNVSLGPVEGASLLASGGAAAGEAAEHLVDGGPSDHGFGHGGGAFVVAGQADGGR